MTARAFGNLSFDLSFAIEAAIPWVGILLVTAGGRPEAGKAQVPDSVETGEITAEGYTMNKSTGALYYYRLNADSTVYLRSGKSESGGPTIDLPASTLFHISDRIERQISDLDERQELLAVGYEDQRLVLRVSQRFDVYLLGLLLLGGLTGGGLLAWLARRLSKERHRRAVLAQSRHFLAEGQEKERKRLAREIHDGPVQELHGLHMQVRALSASSGDRAPRELGDELMRVADELRAISADLHPPALREFGLAAALRSHVDRLQDRHAVEVETEMGEDGPSVPETRALPLFRVAQEALNNAVQHGEAEHIELELQYTPETLRLRVRDDGVGFDPPDDLTALAESGSYGLMSMWERSKSLGADLHVESTPGAGTKVRLNCPLRAEENETKDDRPQRVPEAG